MGWSAEEVGERCSNVAEVREWMKMECESRGGGVCVVLASRAVAKVRRVSARGACDG